MKKIDGEKIKILPMLIFIPLLIFISTEAAGMRSFMVLIIVSLLPEFLAIFFSRTKEFQPANILRIETQTSAREG
jgi:hypothetical protein